MSSPQKKIRSQPADVIVAVGQGDAKQEFDCYKIALSFASPYFDAMLSANMAENNENRIEFPDKDPEEWKLFFRFIDPTQIGQVKHDAIINEENATILTSWFHEFQMEGYVNECDQMLSKKVKSLSEPQKVELGPLSPGDHYYTPDKSLWHLKSGATMSHIRKRSGAFKMIIELLQFACRYDLEKTRLAAEEVIEAFWSDLLTETSDLFDFSTIKVLVDLFLPLAEVDEEDVGGKTFHSLESCGKSSVLWHYLENKDFEFYYLEGMPLDAINNNLMLPALVKSSMHPRL